MTKKNDRYSVPADEDFESGSNEHVLKNYLGITSKAEIEIIEAQELERTETELIELFTETQQFKARDICHIHEIWLKNIYSFAGKYRSVNMSKDDFSFAAANMIDKLMQEFETNFLKKYTPCHFKNAKDLARAIGIVHAELILIHPFREGNGRTARLLADLMAMQSNNPPLDYSPIDLTVNEHGYNDYISAIHASVGHDYEPITQVFHNLIDRQNK